MACSAEVAATAPGTPFYFPALTGVSFFMPDYLERAADRIPTLAGLKFTGSDLLAYQPCLRAGGGAFDVPFGVDEWLLAALSLGARGAVGSTYNFAAAVAARLLSAFEAGDLEAAREEQLRLARLVRLLAGYGYLGAGKATMAILGVDVGPPRIEPGARAGPGHRAARGPRTSRLLRLDRRRAQRSVAPPPWCQARTARIAAIHFSVNSGAERPDTASKSV